MYMININLILRFLPQIIIIVLFSVGLGLGYKIFLLESELKLCRQHILDLTNRVDALNLAMISESMNNVPVIMEVSASNPYLNPAHEGTILVIVFLLIFFFFGGNGRSVGGGSDLLGFPGDSRPIEFDADLLDLGNKNDRLSASIDALTMALKKFNDISFIS